MKSAIIDIPTDKEPIELRGHYRSYDFDGKDLSGFSFKGVDFTNANFQNTNLDNTKFKECILFKADFTKANITGSTQIRYDGMRSPLDAQAKFTNEQVELLGLNKKNNIKRTESFVQRLAETRKEDKYNGKIL